MIAALASTCWLMVNDRGEPHDVDGMVAHYSAGPDAQDAAELSVDRGGVRLSAREQPSPCLVAECDGCRYEFDEDESCAHFTSLDEAVTVLTSCGWMLERTGVVLCSECACERSDHQPTTSHDGVRCRRCCRALPADALVLVSGTLW